MSTKRQLPEAIGFSFQVVGVDVLKSEIPRINLPYQPVDVKHFTIDLEVATDLERSYAIIITKILVTSDPEKKNKLADFDVATAFVVENLNDVLEKLENGTSQLIYPVLIQLTSIALSTSRGVIAQITNGTVLRPCIVPAVIPADLFRDHKDSPNLKKNG